MTQPGHDNKVYELTGPAALPAADMVAIAGRIAGRSIEVQSIPVAEYMAGLEKRGLPPFLVEALGGLQQSWNQNRCAAVTRTVEDLTRTPPAAFEDALRSALA